MTDEELDRLGVALETLLDHFIEKIPDMKIKWKGHLLFR